MAADTCPIFMRLTGHAGLGQKALIAAWFILLTGLGCILAVPGASFAGTRLATLPLQEQVFIRLAGRNTALVQEKRVLALVAGINKIDFSWQNVHIDPGTVYLDTLADPDDITLLSMARASDASALTWELYSSRDTDHTVVISYLLAGLDNLVTYTALADDQEKTLNLDARLILRNFSGQNFDNALFWLTPDTVFNTRLQHLETRQVLFFEQKNLPMTKHYKWDGKAMPHAPENTPHAPGIPTGYKIKNTSDAGLGTCDLVSGKTRIFQEDGQEGTIFSGEDVMPFVPKGDTAFLKIGSSRDILVFKRRLHSEQNRVRRNKKGAVQVYDKLITDRYLLENTMAVPVMLTLTDTIPGQWEPVEMGHAYTLTDHQTLEFDILLDEKEKKTIDLTYKIINIFTGNFARYNKIAPGN
ncbi:MAG: hypothetical protein R6V15_14070 [Desulfotignum sp.]